MFSRIITARGGATTTSRASRALLSRYNNYTAAPASKRAYSILPTLSSANPIQQLRRSNNNISNNDASNVKLQQPQKVNVISAKRTLFIRTTETPNEDALKFLPSVKILPDDKTIEYLSGRDAFNSPLVRKLFTIDGVSAVMLGPDFLTIEKNIDLDWSILKPEIFSMLSDFLSTGEPVIDANAELESDVEFCDDDDEVVSMIKELIFTRIRPAIQEDGGDIEFVDFKENGTVIIRLRGACRSCDSSSITLKNGIEAMLKHYIEEVTAVEQVEEAAADAEVSADADDENNANANANKKQPETQKSPAPKEETLNIQPAKRGGSTAPTEEEVPPML